MPTIELTALQQEAINLTKQNKPTTCIGGYAGTGKTTIISALAKTNNWRVATPTGKAALVLKQKGIHATTIHHLLYKPILDENNHLVGFKKRKRVEAPLLIIDEASMISMELFNDIRNTEGIGKIVLVGDPFQLPPVKAHQYFTDEKLNITLTQVHRQAEKSLVLKTATQIRQQKQINLPFEKRPLAEALKKVTTLNTNTAIITWTNQTRHNINNLITGDRTPKIGDIIIGTRNNHEAGYINGEQYLIEKLGGINQELSCQNAIIKTPEETLRVKLDLGQKTYQDRINTLGGKEEYQAKLGDLVEWDYGYALTTHKAQGSQWQEIYLVPEYPMNRQEANRWYYTAITRAQSQVFLVDSPPNPS